MSCWLYRQVTNNQQLDVQSVKWLEDYLIAHDKVTVLTVSHDSGCAVFSVEAKIR